MLVLGLGHNQLWLYDVCTAGDVGLVSSLTKLQLLNLGANQLTGTLPSFTDLTALTRLELYSNQLTGEVVHVL